MTNTDTIDYPGLIDAATGDVAPGSHGVAASVDPRSVLAELARRGVRAAAFDPA